MNIYKKAMGKGKESLVLGICRQGLIALPTLFALNHFLGLYGIVMAQPISDVCTFVLSTFLYRRVYRKLQKQISREA